MCEIPVFYATTEGQTRRIAERIAEQIRKHGLDSRAFAITSDEAARTDWARVRAAIVGASVHVQKHQREAVLFARHYSRELSSMPSIFFSVSLAAASRNPEEVRAARQLAEKFCAETGWRPLKIASLAGRLAYTQYNWLVRFLMRRIARKEGASLDTIGDHEYTDWAEVERFADELAYQVRRREIFSDGAESLLAAAS